MATHTTHYNLIKPALNDKVNITNLNDNADIIDAALYNKVNTDDTQNITTSANKCVMSDGVTSVEDAVDGVASDLTNLVADANEQKFNISKISQSQTDFVGYGLYNKLTHTVRIYVTSRGTTAVSSTTIATVPAGYRPATTQNLCGIINGNPNACAINNSGQISQTMTSSYTSAFIVGEYKI